jgi:hypothetical protein
VKGWFVTVWEAKWGVDTIVQCTHTNKTQVSLQLEFAVMSHAGNKFVWRVHRWSEAKCIREKDVEAKCQLRGFLYYGANIDSGCVEIDLTPVRPFIN